MQLCSDTTSLFSPHKKKIRQKDIHVLAISELGCVPKASDMEAKLVKSQHTIDSFITVDNE